MGHKKDREKIDEGLREVVIEKVGVTERKDEGLMEHVMGEVEVTERKDEVVIKSMMGNEKGGERINERVIEPVTEEVGVTEKKDKGLSAAMIEEVGGEEREDETKPEGSGDISSTDEGKLGPINSLFSEIEIMVAEEFLILGKHICDINQCWDIVLHKPLTRTLLFVEIYEQWSKRKEEMIPS